MGAVKNTQDIGARFVGHAEATGNEAEAVDFIGWVDKSVHLPGLLKRLAKRPPPTPAIVAAATATLSAKPTSEWFEGASFLHCCALMGVLVKSGEPEASKVVDDAVAGLAPLLADHRVFDPIEIADRVRVAMGAPPAAKTKPRTNPAIDFAVAQGFSVANKSGWYAKIWMAKGEPNEWFGAMQEETQLFLKIDSKHKPYWKLELQPANSRQRYANWSGKVTQDDFGLPPLTRLEDFPGWLGAAGKKMKTSFEPATAKISTGRHRKLGGELRKWLAGS